MARYTVEVETRQAGLSWLATVTAGPNWLRKVRIRGEDQQAARKALENYVAGIRWPHHQFTFVHK